MATLTEAMDAIEAEFDTLRAADDAAGAAELHGEILSWLDEQFSEIYQKSIGADSSGHAADVAVRRASLNAKISP
jgi:hypothetical protein